METLIHDAWVLFVAMGSWMANRMTHKIDTVDKKLDHLRLSSIDRKEYKSDITQLHIRCNELEKSKAPMMQEIGVKIRKGESGENQ